MSKAENHDMVKVASRAYIGREVRNMTVADLILIFIGILSLLVSFGGLIVAFLDFLDRRNKKK